MRKLRDCHLEVVDLRANLAHLLMRLPQKFIQKPQLIHQL
jgi:hypothetical protein